VSVSVDNKANTNSNLYLYVFAQNDLVLLKVYIAAFFLDLYFSDFKLITYLDLVSNNPRQLLWLTLLKKEAHHHPHLQILLQSF